MASREDLHTNQLRFPGGQRWFQGSAAPTVGAHIIGDVTWNTAPAANGNNMGWVCTAAGTPGTWKAFGAVAA